MAMGLSAELEDPKRHLLLRSDLSLSSIGEIHPSDTVFFLATG